MSCENPIIKTRHLCQYYNVGKANEMLALDDVSLEIYPGRVSLLQGPSGSGKTTLLSLIGCMARPYSGTVELNGRTVSKLAEEALARIRRQHFGFIFQQFHLLNDLSTLENCIVPLYPLSSSFSDIRQQGIKALSRFGLSKKIHEKVKNLSGGEQQRVAIARSLVNNPSLLLADEPTAHLDMKRTKDFLAIIEQLACEGMTIVIASHDPILIEASFVNQTFSMRNGRLVSGATF